jgi:hypothetical protein
LIFLHNIKFTFPLSSTHLYDFAVGPQHITTIMAATQQETNFYRNVEQAKADLDSVSAPSTTPSSPGLSADSSRASISSAETPLSPISPSSVADSFVFAFDIDGVLVRGGKAIPEALQAMRVLNGENEFGIHV